MKIPFFSFDQRNKDVRTETMQEFEKFFDSKWYVLGAFTQKFEEEYATFNQVKHCVGVSSGLDALHLALLALGIGEGDEVIVPSNTYIATVLAVSYTGARPVFVEPRVGTANMNPDLLQSAITAKTKCIMPVHLYGQSCEMEAIMQIAQQYNLFVVEDNAQAHGATFNGKLTGSFGDLNATSFYPTKNIGALGEAGAITTNNSVYDDKIRVLRNYGSKERYHNEVVGYNNRIDEFEATFLRVVLKHINGWTKERSHIAEMYNHHLKDISELNLMKVADGATSVHHLYVVQTEKRDALRDYLANQGIGTQIHYPIPPHLQNAYKDLGYSKGDFPIAEALANTSISLPIWTGLGEDQVKYVTESIKSFFSK